MLGPSNTSRGWSQGRSKGGGGTAGRAPSRENWVLRRFWECQTSWQWPSGRI